MSRYWQIITLGFIVLLASCASNDQVYVYKGGASDSAEEASSSLETVVEPDTVALERQRIAEAREKQRQADAQAREAAEQTRQAEAARIAQEEAAATAEAVRQRAQAETQAKQQAQALALEQEQARQEARVAQLRTQIEASKAETSNLEAANATLQNAVRTAENLSAALSTEQQKYSQIDPVTGETLQALDPGALQTLSKEIEQLKSQAKSLASAAD